MKEYQYEALVSGAWSGQVTARNKAEAKRLAEKEIESESLEADEIQVFEIKDGMLEEL